MQHPKKRSLLITGLTLSILLIVLPVILSLLLFHNTISRQMAHRAEQTASFYATQFVERTDSALLQIRSVAYYILSNKNIQAVMQADSRKSVVQDEIGSMILFNPAWDEQHLRQIFLFRNDGTAMPALRSGVYQSEIDRMRAVAERFSDFSAIDTLVTTDGEMDLAYLVLDYTDLNSMEPLGKLLLEIDLSELMDASSLDALYPGTTVVLSNDYGAPIAAHSTLDRETLAEELFRLTQAAQEGTPAMLLGEPVYHLRQPLERFDLQLDICIPSARILESVRQTVAGYVCLTLLVLVVTLAAGLAAYHRLLRPLSQMSSTLDRMAESELSVRMPPARYRELDGPTVAFNRMADRLQDLYRDAYHKGVLLRESEMKMLEAQINPHFIFNVLQVINLRCLEAGQKDTAQLVTGLAALLRGTIGRNGKPKVTFQQELNYVRYYLDLQKARFQDSLQYDIDYADDEILDYYLPKLIIQPLVENSVVHGLEPQRGGGRVTVGIWEEDDSVYIRVEDNGVGFSQAAASDHDQHNHVALDNIRKRLEIMYGTASSFRLRSTPGEGTVALLIIPIDRSEV